MTQPRNPDCPDNPECNVDVDSAGDRFCTVCGLGWGNIGDDDPDDATRERAEALQAWAGPPEVDTTTRLREALADLLEWESRMGGFEAPCWARARALLAELEG